MGVEIEINRIAATEAVSLEANLALVAKHRGELDLKVAEKQAEETRSTPAEGTGITIDKVA